MDAPTFRTEIRTLLGGSLIDVELLDADIDLAFSMAKREYQQKGTNNYDRGFITFEVTADIATYTVPANVNEVIRLIRPVAGFNNENPFHIATLEALMYPVYKASGSGSLLILELAEQYLDTLRNRIKDVDFNFNRFRDTNNITLFQTPAVTETWFMEVLQNLTDDEYREVLWVYKWTLAECKGILGRAYRKLGTINTPAGDANLDGDQLIEDSKIEKEQLLEDIQNYTDGGAVGGYITIG